MLEEKYRLLEREMIGKNQIIINLNKKIQKYDEVIQYIEGKL